MYNVQVSGVIPQMMKLPFVVTNERLNPGNVDVDVQCGIQSTLVAFSRLRDFWT